MRGTPSVLVAGVSGFLAEFAHQLHGLSHLFRRAVHLCVGIDQFHQLRRGFAQAIMVGHVDNRGVQAVLHRLGNVGPARSYFWRQAVSSVRPLAYLMRILPSCSEIIETRSSVPWQSG